MVFIQRNSSSHPPDYRQAIALVAIESCPTVEKSTVYWVGDALTKLGWQVDIFTRKRHNSEPTVIQHSSHCRTIRLLTEKEPMTAGFIRKMQYFQTQQGMHYPLMHSLDETSAWVVSRIKIQRELCWVHTYTHTTPDFLPGSCHEADQIILTQSPLNLPSETLYLPWDGDYESMYPLTSTQARKQLNLSSQEQIVLFVGKIAPQQGLTTLLHAVERSTCADLRLLLVETEKGDRTFLEKTVKTLNLSSSVTFAGQVNPNFLPLYYLAADVCVIPSDYAAFGNVAIEATVWGTPVIASAVGGLRLSVIPEETGLLVPPQNPEALRNAIVSILTDELWSRRFKKYTATLNTSGVAIVLSHLYRQILAKFLTPSLTYSTLALPWNLPLTVSTSLEKVS